jgi:hypothetical protein
MLQRGRWFRAQPATKKICALESRLKAGGAVRPSGGLNHPDFGPI